MVAQARAELGGLHIVVINAGVARGGRNFEEVTEADYDVTFGVHTKGAFNVLVHAWPILKQQR